jgi:modification methylase
VIEAGMIAPGTMLTDARGRFTARVRADGTLAHGDVVGSIHKIGALVQGAEACNGWTFWHVAEGEVRRSIDDFRTEIRARMATA